MTTIIGLAGPGGVGKSTTSKAISKLLKDDGYTVTSSAFAEPLYEVTSLITGIPVEKLKSQDYKETPWTDNNAPIPCLSEWTPRKLLQIIGTECFRENINYDFWIQLAISRVKNYDFAIFEDARFVNEYEKCHVVYELARPGVEYKMNHPSAMPPDKKYINSIIELTPNLDFSPWVQDIIHYRKYGYGLECLQVNKNKV